MPENDAPPWAWSCYFDDQLRILAEDLLEKGLRPAAVSKQLKLGYGELGRLMGWKRKAALIVR